MIVRIQGIQVIQRETELKSAKETLKQFLIRSPLDGTFQVAVNKFTANPQALETGRFTLPGTYNCKYS